MDPASYVPEVLLVGPGQSCAKREVTARARVVTSTTSDVRTRCACRLLQTEHDPDTRPTPDSRTGRRILTCGEALQGSAAAPASRTSLVEAAQGDLSAREMGGRPPHAHAARPRVLLLAVLVAALGGLPPAASARPWAEFPRGGASHEYSHSLTTFSPEVSRRFERRPPACTGADSPPQTPPYPPQGELLQLEHALAAANEAPSSLGLVGKDCVVLLGLEPEMPPLLEAGTPRAMVVNENTVAIYAGLAPDARVLAEHAQDKGVAHEAELGEPMSPAALARAVAEKMQEATQQGGTRPFGASLIIGSCTGSGNAAKPCLFQVGCHHRHRRHRHHPFYRL